MDISVHSVGQVPRRVIAGSHRKKLSSLVRHGHTVSPGGRTVVRPEGRRVPVAPHPHQQLVSVFWTLAI